MLLIFVFVLFVVVFTFLSLPVPRIFPVWIIYGRCAYTKPFFCVYVRLRVGRCSFFSMLIEMDSFGELVFLFVILCLDCLNLWTPFSQFYLCFTCFVCLSWKRLVPSFYVVVFFVVVVCIVSTVFILNLASLI